MIMRGYFDKLPPTSLSHYHHYLKVCIYGILPISLTHIKDNSNNSNNTEVKTIITSMIMGVNEQGRQTENIGLVYTGLSSIYYHEALSERGTSYQRVPRLLD